MPTQPETIEATPEELEDAGQGTLLDERPTRPYIGMPSEAPEPAAQAVQLAEERTNTPARAQEPNPLQMLSQALDAGHDVTKLERLFDLAERYEAKRARAEFASALADFQAECPPIRETKLATVVTKDGGSYSYSYADLDQIMRTVRPYLGKHGLSVRYDAEISDDAKRIKSTCYVMHRGGHQETTTFVVPVDEAMKVNDSQKMGSANSYACRYNVVNALALTTGEDDDAGSLHGRDSGRMDAARPQAAKPTDVDEFFPIGKHKGKPWDQVPLDYLEWVVSNLTDKPDIVERAQKQIDARLDSQEADKGEDVGPSMADCARSITMAKRYSELQEVWSIIPDHHRKGLEKFYETRKRELSRADDDQR